MATKTVTVDTNEWQYIDSTGIPHTITDAQTFTFTLTDGGIAAVTYNLLPNTSMTTTDGLKVYIRQQVDGGNQTRLIGTFADTENASVKYNVSGEFACDCPITGKTQYWKIAKIKINDVDAPTVITSATFEDQFGNVMIIPGTGAGITVA